MSKTKNNRSHDLDGTDRDLGYLFMTLDGLVSSDNPVRLIDIFIDNLISSDPDAYVWKGQSKAGRKSFSASLFLKLYLYCYLNSIRSCRAMEKEVKRNVELIWLTKNLQPAYWTINNFRKSNADSISKMTTKFVEFLVNEEYASISEVATDGSKIKAYASPNVLKMKTTLSRIAKTKEKLSSYMNGLDIEEINETRIQEAINTALTEEVKDEVKLLQERLTKAEEDKRLLELHQKETLAPNDPDAELMKSRNGIKPCYNAQSTVDCKGHFILCNKVKQLPNDINLLSVNIEDLKQVVGQYPDHVLADTGYANLQDIKDLEESSPKVICTVPLPRKAAKHKDKKANISFTYDPINDEYTCSQEQKLTLIHKNKKKGNAHFNIYQTKECLNCSKKADCTSSKSGRSIQRSVNAEWNEQYEEQMKLKENIELNIKRKSVVEHPFGTIKWMMGKFEFLLTGKDKVQIELDLLSIAYNLKRLINCASIPDLIKQFKKYSWSKPLLTQLYAIICRYIGLTTLKYDRYA